MAEATLDIKRWGNNLGVRIPAAVAREAGLRENQTVRVSAENGRVIITPEVPATLSLDERLARFDPQLHGGEVMPSAPVGAERW